MDGGHLWWFPGMSDGSYGLPTQDGKLQSLHCKDNASD